MLEVKQQKHKHCRQFNISPDTVWSNLITYIPFTTLYIGNMCWLVDVLSAVIYHLAPTTSWFLLRSRASWEKSFTPGRENSDIHGLKAGQRKNKRMRKHVRGKTQGHNMKGGRISAELEGEEEGERLSIVCVGIFLHQMVPGSQLQPQINPQCFYWCATFLSSESSHSAPQSPMSLSTVFTNLPPTLYRWWMLDEWMIGLVLMRSPWWETTGCSFRLQSAGLMWGCWDRHTDEHMTSTRPQGERAHAPHPDVTIVTTTSSLLTGPQETPVGREEKSKTNCDRYIHFSSVKEDVSLNQKHLYCIRLWKSTLHLHILPCFLSACPSIWISFAIPPSPAVFLQALSVCLLWVSSPSVSAGLGHG